MILRKKICSKEISGIFFKVLINLQKIEIIFGKIPKWFAENF